MPHEKCDFCCGLRRRSGFPFMAVMAATLVAVTILSTNAHSQTAPSWVGNLLLENSTITADPTLTAPEAQGLGLKFELLYAMTNDQDPLNSDNDVISLIATSTAIGVAVRNMLPGTTVASMTDQVNIKYYLPGGDWWSHHLRWGFATNSALHRSRRRHRATQCLRLYWPCSLWRRLHRQ